MNEIVNELIEAATDKLGRISRENSDISDLIDVLGNIIEAIAELNTIK